MGTFEVSDADGTHPILVDQGSTHKPKTRVDVGISARHPIGALGKFEVRCRTYLL